MEIENIDFIHITLWKIHQLTEEFKILCSVSKKCIKISKNNKKNVIELYFETVSYITLKLYLSKLQ